MEPMFFFSLEANNSLPVPIKEVTEKAAQHCTTVHGGRKRCNRFKFKQERFGLINFFYSRKISGTGCLDRLHSLYWRFFKIGQSAEQPADSMAVPALSTDLD